MGEFAIGQPVSRLEDPRLLKGLGRYIDDLDLPGQAYACILRSPYAHARIRAIDAGAATAMPGVLGVLTGADCEADGLGHLPCDQKRFRRDGSDMYRPPRPVLVRDRVRVVGDYVAMGVAETASGARDAAERIAVDYEELAAVVSPADAAADGAPLLWEDCPGNECFFHEDGDAEAVEAAFAAADLVVERRFTISRVTAAPIGPRGCIGEYDPSLERYTLRTGVQQAHMLRMHLARTVFGIPETRVRVIAPDIGGSFGLYSNVYPENALVLWAARRFARPVKWTAERSECMLSDDSARDCVSDAALALDRDGAVSRAALQELRQSRRLSVAARPAAAGGQSRHAGRHLYYARDSCPGLGHVHQHVLHLALSRRRQARGLDGAGAAHRRGGAPPRPRPGRNPPPQHHPRRRHALQDGAHLHL